jgi:hypothetical protein
MTDRPLQGAALRFAQLMASGMPQGRAWVESGHANHAAGASRAWADPRVRAYVAAHLGEPAPAPPAPRPPPPPIAPRPVSDSPDEFDAIAEAETAVIESRGNPAAHRRALGVLASLYRFAGRVARQGADGAGRSVASSQDDGRAADASVLDDAAMDAFLDAIDNPTPPEPADWQAFLKAAGLPLDTVWTPAPPRESVRIVDEMDHARQVVLARISESLE